MRRMTLLAVGLWVLAIAAPALSGSWTQAAPTAAPGGRQSELAYEWTTVGDKPPIATGQCTLGLEAAFDPSVGDASTDARVKISGCFTATDSDSACRELNASFPSETQFTSLGSAYPYLLVHPLVATSGGDVAQVRIRCREASDPASPFVSNGVATENAYDAIRGLPHFAALPAEYPRFFFSNNAGGDFPLGVDTNPCSQDRPCLTLTSKALALMQSGSGVEIVIDAGDTWSHIGNIATASCPASGIATGRPCFVISGSDYSGRTKVLFDGNALSSGVGFFISSDATAAQTSGALWAMQNVRISCTSTTTCDGSDGVSVGGGVAAVLLNVDIATKDNSGVATGHSIVTRDNGTAVILNSRLVGTEDTGADGVAQGAVLVATETDAGQTANILALNTFVDQQDTDVAAATPLARMTGAARIFWLGGGMTYSGGDTAIQTFGITDEGALLNDGLDSTITLARLLFGAISSDNTSVTLRFAGTVNTTERQRVTLRQNTFSGKVAIARYFSGSGLVLDEKYDVADELNGATSPPFWVNATSVTDLGAGGKSTVRIESSVWDQDDGGAGTAIYNASLTTSYTCANGVTTPLGGETRHLLYGDASGNNCATAFESGGTGSNGDVFGGTGGVDADGMENQGNCAASSVCSRATPDGYTLAHPLDVNGKTIEIPAFVLGARITSWRLGAPGQDLGR